MVVAMLGATLGSVLVVAVSLAGEHLRPPASWPGVLAAYLGAILFFVFMMLGGAGRPREVLPGTLAHVADGAPVTYAARLIREVWLGRGWDLGATGDGGRADGEPAPHDVVAGP